MWARPAPGPRRPRGRRGASGAPPTCRRPRRRAPAPRPPVCARGPPPGGPRRRHPAGAAGRSGRRPGCRAAPSPSPPPSTDSCPDPARSGGSVPGGGPVRGESAASRVASIPAATTRSTPRMARNATPPPEDYTERIVDIEVEQEMQEAFLEYAYSVIYSRALPDARDGLKPVQRRILFQMAERGLRPDRAHVKSARVVGDVMGKLHPHGDASIYDAMVRLAQDFIQRVPLVDGHANFGTLCDGPAAARYTEARLAAAALALTEDLDEDVVDFVPNYDNQLMQPDVLPAAFPNLLVNGASGIAVGMATNMAPHNLIEVVGAARHLLAHPDATLDDLMEFVPGPDLPSGGTIAGLAGVRDAYATGRGSFRMRAKVTVESITARKSGLVV